MRQLPKVPFALILDGNYTGAGTAMPPCCRPWIWVTVASVPNPVQARGFLYDRIWGRLNWRSIVLCRDGPHKFHVVRIRGTDHMGWRSLDMAPNQVLLCGHCRFSGRIPLVHLCTEYVKKNGIDSRYASRECSGTATAESSDGQSCQRKALRSDSPAIRLQ